jgi:hypothetical protein
LSLSPNSMGASGPLRFTLNAMPVSVSDTVLARRAAGRSTLRSVSARGRRGGLAFVRTTPASTPRMEAAVNGSTRPRVISKASAARLTRPQEQRTDDSGQSDQLRRDHSTRGTS